MFLYVPFQVRWSFRVAPVLLKHRDVMQRKKQKQKKQYV